MTEDARSGEGEPGRDLRLGLAAGALLEAVTLLARFGLGLESTRDTAALAAWTFGIRIHHGYIGLLVFALSYLGRLPPRYQSWARIVGVALVVSDLVHHFVVLWPITGDHQFHLRYPG